MSPSVRFDNYSLLVGKKYDDDWFEWCVFVTEPREVLNLIVSVEYTLHPTFPNPVRKTSDRQHRFPILSSGWGEFSIYTRVDFTNGASERGRYALRLGRASWPMKDAPARFPDGETERVYRPLIHEKYRWRRTATIMKESGLVAERVLQILVDLEAQQLVRKAFFRSIDQAELWGATAVVGLLPNA